VRTLADLLVREKSFVVVVAEKREKHLAVQSTVKYRRYMCGTSCHAAPSVCQGRLYSLHSPTLTGVC
jgi:hypothetical protein